MVGIILALVMRAVFIAVGAVAIEQFTTDLLFALDSIPAI
jgi:predicted tellurium resistance membrane protein TerC